MRQPRYMILGCALAAYLGAGALVLAGEIPEDASPMDFRKIITSAKAKVYPAVVFIMSVREEYEEGKKQLQQISGSGVVISEKGEAVTNWHVVDKSVTLRCLLFNGDVGTAKVIGTDKDTDIALIQISVPGKEKFPYAELGDSDKLTEGQFVMAMGAPWGLSRSVSLGILSCTTRFLDAHTGGYNLWLQTDASINPGNSGGPLVNTDGVVIGINTLGTLWGGDMAFSVPSNVVKRTVNGLREHGHVVRAWTGISLQPLKDFEQNIFYDADTGVLVAGVDDGSPAEKAGLRIKDLILKVNGKAVSGVNREDIPAINQALAELEIDKEASLEIKRDGQAQTIALTPRNKGEVEGKDFDCELWNMTVKAINEFDTPQLHFFKKTGVFVQGVKSPGNASNSGVDGGDIILTLDGREVNSMEDMQKAYKEIVADEKREKKFQLLVLRSGLKHYVVVDYKMKYEDQ